MRGAGYQSGYYLISCMDAIKKIVGGIIIGVDII